MLFLKRILLLALVALLVVFAFQNQKYLFQPVELVFFKVSQTLVLGFWLLISFLAGAAVFLLADLPRSFSLRRELSRKTQELSRLQAQMIDQGKSQGQAMQVAPTLPGADLSKPAQGEAGRRLDP